MSVRLTRIDVTQARGITTGESFTVRDFAPRINIIHGPNGSGKSTLALAIRQTLWPEVPDLQHAFLRAEWVRDGRPVEVVIHGGQATGEGVSDTGPAERRGRYLLALHELVAAESDSEADFVERLVRAAMGEFDIPEATRRLKWTASPSRPRKLETALRDAEEARRLAAEAQRKLAEDEARLDGLTRSVNEAVAAASRLGAVRLALDVKALEDDVRDLESRMASIPDTVRALRGTEPDELRQLDDAIAELDHEARNQEAVLEGAQAGIKDTGFATEPPSDLDLDIWRERARTLAERERDRSAALAEVSAAQQVSSAAWLRLAAHGELSDQPIPTEAQADELVELWTEWAELHAERLGLEQQHNALQKLAGDTAAPSDEALRRIGRWIRAVDAHPRHPAFNGALAVLTGTILLLAWLVTPAFLAGLLIPPGLYWWARSAAGTAAERAVIESEWRRDAPDSVPSAWTEEAVMDLWNRLADQKGRAAVEHAARSRMEALDVPAAELARRRAQWTKRMEALGEASGIHLAGHTESSAWLGVLVQRIRILQDARAAQARAEGRLKAADEAIRTGLAELNTMLEGRLVSPVASASDAETVVNQVATRAAAWINHDADRKRAQSALETRIRPGLEKRRTERRSVLQRAGLSEETRYRLDEVMHEFSTFRELSQQLGDARTLMAGAKSRLAAAVADADARLDAESVVQESRAALEEQERTLSEVAARADAYREERTRIGERIDMARSRRDLTEALERRDGARAELDAYRHAAIRQIAGSAVADWVRTEAMRRSMPAVFSRAQDLLARFTSGALHLDVDLSGEVPRIVAESASGLPRSMGQLSVGERVQLLIAVRVAFLEHEEQVALPLLVDEALGTSDDERARVIIDTLLQLAADGRQIFYFTAQLDEVAKWRERIVGSGQFSDADWATIDLSAVRRGEAGRLTPLPDVDVPRREVPAPDERSHAAYLRELGVPGLDPLRRDVGAEHVGHVVEDPETLHRLLIHGVESVFAWKTLSASSSPLCGSVRERADIEARIRALEDATDLWRTGRGRPVDRTVLEASGAVSSNFIDAVADLARSVHGDAGRVVDALEAGDVPRFQKAKIQDLREWLLDNGYLDDRTPLVAGEARIQLVARHPGLPPETIDRIVHTLWTTD